jgi:RNA polymerase sigma factor (sigma-70 family)
MPGKTDTNPIPADTSRFATTHWSLVLAAGSPESTRYRMALETLCQTYWFPLYAYLRRRGYNTHLTEDYVQGFFSYLLEKHVLHRANPERGRFRSFLLATLKHYLTDERDRARTQKRGGVTKILSLNIETAESQYSVEPAHHLSPEKLFERQWALTLLNRTICRLKAESLSKNKPNLFTILETYLTLDEDSVPYGDIATKLNMTEGAVKVAVHRLRNRYRELLRDEIAHTVAAEDQIDEEIRDLFTAVAG